MSPVEIIALFGCSRPEDGRPCKICIGQAEKHVRAVESAGLVVVSAEDFRYVLDKAEQFAFHRFDADDSVRIARLRAALPERTENA